MRKAESTRANPATGRTAPTNFRAPAGNRLVSAWFEVRCIPDPEHIHTFAELLADYMAFVQLMDVEPASQKAFGLALTDLGVPMTIREAWTGRGRRIGVRLRPRPRHWDQLAP